MSETVEEASNYQDFMSNEVCNIHEKNILSRYYLTSLRK